MKRMYKQTAEHLRNALVAVQEVSNAALNDLSLKWCCECKQVKPTSFFYKNRSRADGLDSRCSQCSLRRSRVMRELDSNYFNKKAKENYAKRKSIFGWIKKLIKDIIQKIMKLLDL